VLSMATSGESSETSTPGGRLATATTRPRYRRVKTPLGDQERDSQIEITDTKALAA